MAGWDRKFNTGFLLLVISNLLSSETIQEEPDGYLRREYSLIKPYSGGSLLQFWEVAGTTFIHDNFIRLTADQTSAKGQIWNTLPVFSRDWEIHLSFNVHGHNSRLFGDGFAFWYAKEKSVLGDVFGSKDYFSGLGIFFDTYANQNGEHSHEHPYISAQVNNGTIHYDHDRDGTHSELAGCNSYFRGVDKGASVVIRYLGSQKRLIVKHDVEDDGLMECIDQFGVELPTGLFFGLSAQTGDLSDNHDILSMKFYELGEDDDSADYSNIVPKASNAEGERDHVDDLPTTTRRQKAFSWVMVLLVIIAIAGIGGFFYYQKVQRENQKRFY